MTSQGNKTEIKRRIFSNCKKANINTLLNRYEPITLVKLCTGTLENLQVSNRTVLCNNLIFNLFIFKLDLFLFLKVSDKSTKYKHK